MVNAIKLYLEQIGGKAGDFTVSYESFDDSTAAKGAWDEATCAANARKYVEDESILGVIGTFNSGCAKIEVPIANEASLAYVSPANTAVGLTHEGPGSEPVSRTSTTRAARATTHASSHRTTSRARSTPRT